MNYYILRPSSMYGEGDRHILPKYSKYLKKGRMILIGGGKSLYPIMHASDMAKVVVTLATKEQEEENKSNIAIYNLCDDSNITQKEFITTIQQNIGLDGKLKSVPYLPIFWISMLFELKGKLLAKEPFIFRKRIKYLGVTRQVSIEKAKKELGFKPEWHPIQGIPAVIQALTEEEEYKKNAENVIVNGMKEKEILNLLPYHLYKQLKNR